MPDIIAAYAFSRFGRILAVGGANGALLLGPIRPDLALQRTGRPHGRPPVADCALKEGGVL